MLVLLRFYCYIHYFFRQHSGKILLKGIIVQFPHSLLFQYLEVRTIKKKTNPQQTLTKKQSLHSTTFTLLHKYSQNALYLIPLFIAVVS